MFGSCSSSLQQLHRANSSSYIHIAQQCALFVSSASAVVAMYKKKVVASAQGAQHESVAPPAPSLRHIDCCRLHFAAFAPSPPAREALRPNLPKVALLKSLRKRFDCLSQLLAILCVPLSKQANNAWYIHTQVTSSKSTGATRDEAT